MVIIITGLLIVVVDRYRRERQRIADVAARGEYAAVSGKEVEEGTDTDVELAQGGAGFTALSDADRRRSATLVAAPDGHVDLGMFVAAPAPVGGGTPRVAASHDGSWRIGTAKADLLGPLRPERALNPASVRA